MLKLSASKTPILLILLLLASQFFYIKYLLPAFSPHREEQAMFGDSFGAMNAFISGCAFICLIISIHQQGKQIAENKNDVASQLTIFREQAEEASKANRALAKQLKLAQISSQLSTLPNLIEAELTHLERHHANELSGIPIRSLTAFALEDIYKKALTEMQLLQKCTDSGEPIPHSSRMINHSPSLGHFRCFVENIHHLKKFKSDLFNLYAKLELESETEE